MRSASLIRAQKKYDAKNSYQVSIKLNRSTDADIIEKLEAEPNKQGYIKAVIRQIINQEAHEDN